jgi:hypothetical protein
MDPKSLDRRPARGRQSGAAKSSKHLDIASDRLAEPLRAIIRGKRAGRPYAADAAASRVKQIQAIREKGKGLKGSR